MTKYLHYLAGVATPHLLLPFNTSLTLTLAPLPRWGKSGVNQAELPVIQTEPEG